MSLSVCLLTRNEEGNLPRAIGSVIGIADEILVADTGSSDRTVEVAKELGARLAQIDWQDDFAGARDATVAQATGDWILWLNPDEEFAKESRDELTKCQTRSDIFAFLVRVRELRSPDPQAPAVDTAQLKLFRRHPGLHSVGRLHPRFEPSLESLASAQAQSIGVANIVIRHHAYQSQLTESKLRWIVRLFELELRDRPGQLPYLIEFGRTLLLLNDPRGHEILGEAAERVGKMRESPLAPAAQVQKLLEYLLSVNPGQSRSRMSREEAAELALKWFPKSPPLLWKLAEQAFAVADHCRAAELLQRLVELGQTGAYDRSEGFDPGILGDSAILNLVMCHLQMGNFDRAEQLCLPLVTRPNPHPQAIELLTRAQISRHQPPG